MLTSCVYINARRLHCTCSTTDIPTKVLTKIAYSGLSDRGDIGKRCEQKKTRFHAKSWEERQKTMTELMKTKINIRAL